MRRAYAVLIVLLSPCALLSQQPSRPQAEVPAPSTLVVQVRAADGTPLPGFAMVRLFSMFVNVNLQQTTIDGGRATFPGVPVGEYRVEVTAAGYEKAEEEVQVLVPGSTAFAMVNMRPEGSPAPAKPSGPPVLAPKPRRALEKGMALLQANDPVGARPFLEQAYKLAPNYPDIVYLLGVVYLRLSREAEAKDLLEKAIKLDPGHVAAMNSLSAVLIMQSQNARALEVLTQALKIAPDSWKTHWILATLQVRMREMPSALEHVDKAIQLSAGVQPEMYVLRSQLLEAVERFDEAIAQWEEFLRSYPDRPEAATARQRLERARARKAAAVAARTAPAAPALTPPRATPLVTVNDEAKSLNLNVKWAPPDVDDSPVAVEPGVTCPLPDVLKGTRRRAESLVETLQSFTAIEKVRRQMYDSEIAADIEWTFDYQAMIEQPRRGNLSVTDFRTAKGPGVANNLHSSGIAAMALILHPFYADDFEMSCDGRAMLGGQAAWVVRFRQRADRMPRVRAYYQQGRRFPVRLKGRAWVSVNSGHVLRLQTDLLEPIPELRITRDHLVIDYAPVQFQKRNVRVWLPSTVDFYTDFGGKRYRYHHSYTDFMLFAVDTNQKIAEPTPPPEMPPQ